MEKCPLKPREAKYYYARDAWDVTSWRDVIAIEYEKLIETYPFNEKLRPLSENGDIKLLDIGCGTGIFPSYLDKVLSEPIHLSCDLLDLSASSLQQCKRVLSQSDHFTAHRSHKSLIEDIPTTLSAQASHYDVIWAIHSLTTVDVRKMTQVYLHLLDLLAPEGYLFIYQLTAGSSYQKLHSFYRAYHPQGKKVAPFMEYEDTQKILDSIHPDYKVHELFLTHVIGDDRTVILEKYLRKCILDDSVDALKFFETLLEEFHKEEKGEYQFPQQVNFVVVQRR